MKNSKIFLKRIFIVVINIISLVIIFAVIGGHDPKNPFWGIFITIRFILYLIPGSLATYYGLKNGKPPLLAGVKKQQEKGWGSGGRGGRGL